VDVVPGSVSPTFRSPDVPAGTVYDPVTDAFYVNIADPPQIVVVGPAIRCAPCVWRSPKCGPHGLDIDVARRRLFCAFFCDAGVLLELDADGGKILATARRRRPGRGLFTRPLGRLYVAIGDPASSSLRHGAAASPRDGTTEPGAHTRRSTVCAASSARSCGDASRRVYADDAP